MNVRVGFFFRWISAGYYGGGRSFESPSDVQRWTEINRRHRPGGCWLICDACINLLAIIDILICIGRTGFANVRGVARGGGGGRAAAPGCKTGSNSRVVHAQIGHILYALRANFAHMVPPQPARIYYCLRSREF